MIKLHSSLFLRSWLGGSYVHVLIELHGVTGHDLTVCILRKPDGIFGFSGGRGPCYNDYLSVIHATGLA